MYMGRIELCSRLCTMRCRQVNVHCPHPKPTNPIDNGGNGGMGRAMSSRTLGKEWVTGEYWVPNTLDSLQYDTDNGHMTESKEATWHRSMVPGCYVSADGRYTAELRPAGFYPEFACKLVRHYAIRLAGSSQIVGTAKTLKEAGEMYR